MAILIDYSQIAKGILLEFVDELKVSTKEQVTKIVRHVMLNTIKSYKKKFGDEYGEIIVVCDSSNVWRRDFFKEYKHKRREAIKESEIDWDFIFEVLSQLALEIKAFLPYKVLKVDRTEADDIIGIVTKYICENETSVVGLIEDDAKVLAISSDKDYKYLYKFKGYRQWSPMTKEFVTLDKGQTPESYLNELICRGDKGDGVPSVYSQDDQFVLGIRQKALSAEVVQEFIEKGREACKDEWKIVKNKETKEKVNTQVRSKAIEERNWDRNNLMINHDMIPNDYKEAIIESYKSATCNNNKNLLMEYLLDKDLKMLLQNIEEF